MTTIPPARQANRPASAPLMPTSPAFGRAPTLVQVTFTPTVASPIVAVYVTADRIIALPPKVVFTRLRIDALPPDDLFFSQLPPAKGEARQ